MVATTFLFPLRLLFWAWAAIHIVAIVLFVVWLPIWIVLVLLEMLLPGQQLPADFFYWGS